MRCSRCQRVRHTIKRPPNTRHDLLLMHLEIMLHPAIDENVTSLIRLEVELRRVNARAANAGAARLAAACGDRLLHPVEANEVFLRLSGDEAARLRAQGYDFYDWGEGAARMVVSWHHDAAAVDPLAAAIAAL